MIGRQGVIAVLCMCRRPGCVFQAVTCQASGAACRACHQQQICPDLYVGQLFAATQCLWVLCLPLRRLQQQPPVRPRHSSSAAVLKVCLRDHIQQCRLLALKATGNLCFSQDLPSSSGLNNDRRLAAILVAGI